MRDVCTKTISWLSENDHASEQEYTRKKQEIETVCRPITMRLYSNASAAGFNPNMGRQFPNTGSSAGGVGTGGGGGGPIIDEAD